MSIFEYNEELHIQMERADAREEGYAEGVQKIAKAMLKANEPLEKILKYSGLSPEEIDRLKSE